MKTTKVQNRSTKDDLILNAIPRACADEIAAVEFIELQRWNGNPACPRCGDMNVYQMRNSKTGKRQANYRWRCRGCTEQFTVRIGTVFEDSRIQLRHWCFAFWRAATSKKGVSALEIHRQTGVSYKSALFMLHRIRFAMAPETASQGKLTGIVEADETYVGGKPRYRGRSKRGHGTSKQPVAALVARGGGVRTRVITKVNTKNLKAVMREHVDQSARIMTDESVMYRWVAPEYAGHQSVNHSHDEYVRGEVHVNTAESFFALLKRGLHGIYHAVSKKHLHRYLAHAEFLYNNRELEDGDRVIAAIRAADGKRLMYKEPLIA